MSLDATASGVFAIAVTPFTDTGEIDFASVDRMVAFYRGCGVNGLTVLGMMGEAPKIEISEAIAFVKAVVAAARELPVIVGVSAPGFAAMGALSTAAMDAGAAGVMIAPPGTMRTNEQIIGYFDQCVAAIGERTPFVIQDYPLSSGVVIPVSVIREIVSRHPTCVMLKHEDWPGLEKISKLRALETAKDMRRIAILTGNGGLFLDFEMERGADGAMTGYAFPDMLSDVIAAQQRRDRDSAHDLFDAHLPLLRYEQQPGLGLAVRKHILKLRGAIASDAQRAPATSMTEAARSEVAYLLTRVAKHDPRAADLV